MDTKPPDSEDMPERLPEALRARLAAADRRARFGYPDVDAAVLAEARAYFARRDGGARNAGVAAGSRETARSPEARSRGRPGWAERRAGSPARRPSESVGRAHDLRRRRSRWAAGVAAAAVVVAALVVVRPFDGLRPYDPDDVDRSGRVDILDAFVLARRRAEGAPIADAQIDAIATRAVALESGRTGR